MDIAKGILMTLVVSVKAYLHKNCLHMLNQALKISQDSPSPLLPAKRVGNQHEFFVCISIGMMFLKEPVRQSGMLSPLVLLKSGVQMTSCKGLLE